MAAEKGPNNGQIQEEEAEMTEPAVYLTIRQAARLLGVHPKTLRRYLEEGKLSGVAVTHTDGGHHRFQKRSLLAWQHARRETGDGPGG